MGLIGTSLHAMAKAAVITVLVGIGSTVAAQPASAQDAVLDGTYKLYFGPSPLPSMTYWYAFHTDCSNGCTAIGDQVNTDDRSGPHEGFDGTVSLQFLDGQWLRSGQYDRVCADGSIVRFMWSWTLTQQPDGTLTGVRVIDPSGRCAEYETSFITQPITATRA